MNAIPDKSLRAEKRLRGQAAETEGVRLTIDFDEDDAVDQPGARPRDAFHDRPDGTDSAAAVPDPWADGVEAPRAALEDVPSRAAAGPDPGRAAAGRASAAPGAGASGPNAGAAPDASGLGTSARRKTMGAMPAQLAGIEVTLSVEIGSHRLPLKDLLSVDPGQLFPLDRMTSEPVAILVNGRPFARGEVVAIGDRFGVRLLDILGADDDPC